MRNVLLAGVILVAFGSTFSAVSLLNPECTVKSADRKQCGYGKVSYNNCVISMRCCYDYAKGQCYFKKGLDEPGKPPMPKFCTFTSKREQCGVNGITEYACISTKGCCYDNTPGAVNCYMAKQPKRCRVPLGRRKACGKPGINKERCRSIYCCYDDSPDAITKCYKDP